MKQFILGFVSAVAIFVSIPSATSFVAYHFPPEKDSKWDHVSTRLRFNMYFTPDLLGTFMERCTKDIGMNGFGTVFVTRHYFKCNKLEILISDLIYGEKTSKSKEDKADQICDNCTM